MTEENKQILHTLQKVADRLREQKMTLKDISEEDIHSIAQIVFNERIHDKFSQLYFLAQHYGDSEQQSAVIALLGLLMEFCWEKEDSANEKFNEILQQNELYRKYYDIVSTYSENRLTQEYIQGKTWEDVAVLKQGKDISIFSKVCDAVNQSNIERIKKQSKIRIGFLTKDSAEWSVDSLYQKLAQDERYEVYVFVAPFFVGSEITIKDIYEQAVKYFEDKGYPTIAMGKRLENGAYVYLPWDGMPKIDVLFLLNPHLSAFWGTSNITSFPLQMLNIYIPYGFPIYGNIQDQYNQLSHALCWKIFCLTEMDAVISRKYADLGDKNVEVSGYIKMDGFYKEECPVAEDIWKIPEGKSADEIKKVIYAPHWSIRNACTGFGNFDKMYDKMYEYAKEHTETTSWIFRPHPMLGFGAVAQGLFHSQEEFDDYMRKWDELPNAKVVERGEYIDIFRTSDALIGDSISFLGEYQYTHKPLLFITRESNTFDDFGSELIKILYRASGEDFEAVEKFIQEVVVEEKDTMYEVRKQFFDKYMDYRKRNGKLASDYVKHYLDTTFTE